PKSFLGASGLHDVQVSFFEDLVCAMMANIKHQAERTTQEQIKQAVIGRPINFHGRGGEEANRQAEDILTRAAKRAGFLDIAFQFEPVAAGLDYESTLTENQTVLVVDIGGGTTDCSLLEMGPSWSGQADRTQSLLAHSGQRVGGNDLDIYLAFKQLMSPFGMGSKGISGIDMPLTQFWNPIAINNVEAQKNFYSRENLAALKLLRKEASEPQKLDRLMKVYHDTLGYGIVRRAEETKIALAESAQYRAAISVASELVEVDISVEQMIDAIETPKSKMIELVKEAIQQGQKKPDVIYMTGGSARSPILREAVQQAVPNVPIVSGNYFGSVTAGLARWAEVCFK
ncbi:molecular chaperone, partial [Vibrio sp.]|uniref:molecular chaperone n=1 Tax=Vibrio sp. TaxID=678 RepID=UPI0037B41058